MKRQLVAVVVVACSLLLAACQNDRPGWGWTSWNMTEMEFAIVAWNRAGPVGPKPLQHLNFEPLREATGNVTQDGFAFRASFAFDSGDHRLKVVSLGLKDYGRCDALLEVMSRKLGPPPTRNLESTGRGLTWPDDGQGSRVNYTEFYPTADRPGLCRLIYWPSGPAR